MMQYNQQTVVDNLILLTRINNEVASIIVARASSIISIELGTDYVPEQLASIVLDLSLYLQGRLGNEALKSQTLDVIKQDYRDDIPTYIQSAINQYRNQYLSNSTINNNSRAKLKLLGGGRH